MAYRIDVICGGESSEMLCCYGRIEYADLSMTLILSVWKCGLLNEVFYGRLYLIFRISYRLACGSVFFWRFLRVCGMIWRSRCHCRKVCLEHFCLGGYVVGGHAVYFSSLAPIAGWRGSTATIDRAVLRERLGPPSVQRIKSGLSVSS